VTGLRTRINSEAVTNASAAILLKRSLIEAATRGTRRVQRVEVALKTSDAGLSGAATSLKIQVLAFLALFL
jgi:hypothetical protein